MNITNFLQECINNDWDLDVDDIIIKRRKNYKIDINQISGFSEESRNNIKNPQKIVSPEFNKLILKTDIKSK